MTVFDYVFLSILGLSTVLGLWRGVVSEILAVAAWILAVIAAWRYGDVAASLLEGTISDPGWRAGAAFALVVLVVLLLMSLARVMLRRLLRAVGLGATDRFLGAAFGLVRGLAIAFVIVLLGGLVGMSREAWWEQAMFAPPLEEAVVASKPYLPDAVADRIHFR